MKSFLAVIFITVFAAFIQANDLKVGAASLRETRVAEKPNIVFIFSDDLSYRDLSCYGQKHFQTPNLDRLALEGMRFTNAYSGACECAPSRASLMTGMHMGHARIRRNGSVRGQDHLLEEDVTVAEVLKQAGYATGFTGKWGIGLSGTPGVPHRQGFDFAYGYYDQGRAHGFFPEYLIENGRRIEFPENKGFNMARVYRYNSVPLEKAALFQNTYDDTGKLIPDGVKDPATAKYSENLINVAALKFVRENAASPFFLYYATQLPHGPVITPELGKFKDKPWPLKNKEWAAMMTHLDRSVGNIVTLLEELKIRENTIIFFAGDNGYSQYGYFRQKQRWSDDPLFHNKGPWRGGKFANREGGVRVPFFVNWPGKIASGESSHICALYDFLATAAYLAGTKVPKNDGISLLPTLTGNSAAQ